MEYNICNLYLKNSLEFRTSLLAFHTPHFNDVGIAPFKDC